MLIYESLRVGETKNNSNVNRLENNTTCQFRFFEYVALRQKLEAKRESAESDKTQASAGTSQQKHQRAPSAPAPRKLERQTPEPWASAGTNGLGHRHVPKASGPRRL